MFAFIEHGQPHNHHGGENTITLSHASVRRPCQKLTKSLTSQVRASENISTLGRRSLRPSQRHQNPTLQIVAVKYGLHDQISLKTVRISPQLRRGAGRHRFPYPVHLRKWLWSPKETKAVKTILMERATGSPRICFANPCFAAGLRPLRATPENAHAFSQLRTLAGSIPVARRVNENSSDPQRKPKPLKQFLWSGRRESNPRHQLGRLGFYH